MVFAHVLQMSGYRGMDRKSRPMANIYNGTPGLSFPMVFLRSYQWHKEAQSYCRGTIASNISIFHT